MRIERMQSNYRVAEGTASLKDRHSELAETPIKMEKEKENIQDQEMRKKELEETIEKINQAAGIFNKKIHLEIHEDTNRVMVKVMNAETGDVISEIPPKKILDMLASMEEMIGVLVDKRA